MKFQAVAEAVYARLNGFAALTDQVISVGYQRSQDAEPEDETQFPYVVIDDVVQRPWDTKTANGGNQLVQVTVFARDKEFKSAITVANEVAQSVYDALHKYDLKVSGVTVVNCLFEETPGNIADPDGVTRFKPMTFRIIYDEA